MQSHLALPSCNAPGTARWIHEVLDSTPLLAHPAPIVDRRSFVLALRGKGYFRAVAVDSLVKLSWNSYLLPQIILVLCMKQALKYLANISTLYCPLTRVFCAEISCITLG